MKKKGACLIAFEGDRLCRTIKCWNHIIKVSLHESRYLICRNSQCSSHKKKFVGTHLCVRSAERKKRSVSSSSRVRRSALLPNCKVQGHIATALTRSSKICYECSGKKLSRNKRFLSRTRLRRGHRSTSKRHPSNCNVSSNPGLKPPTASPRFLAEGGAAAAVRALSRSASFHRVHANRRSATTTPLRYRGR